MKFSLKKNIIPVVIIVLTIAAAAVGYRFYAGTMDARYQNFAVDIAGVSISYAMAAALVPAAVFIPAVFRTVLYPVPQPVALNRSRDADLGALVQAVRDDIRIFAKEQNSSDNMMMPASEMNSVARLYRLELAPALEELPRATAFVEQALQKEQVPRSLVYKLNVVIDEMFSNIARYSGASWAAIVCFVQDGKVTLRLEDDGKPFDPLAADDPDITLSAQERSIGGLGVFLVKRMADEIQYERRQAKNCLTVALRLPERPPFGSDDHC